MKPYLLLTPGPLTTSETVKEAMMTDWCTWDEDYNLGIVGNSAKTWLTSPLKTGRIHFHPFTGKRNLLRGGSFRRHHHPRKTNSDL